MTKTDDEHKPCKWYVYEDWNSHKNHVASSIKKELATHSRTDLVGLIKRLEPKVKIRGKIFMGSSYSGGIIAILTACYTLASASYSAFHGPDPHFEYIINYMAIPISLGFFSMSGLSALEQLTGKGQREIYTYRIAKDILGKPD